MSQFNQIMKPKRKQALPTLGSKVFSDINDSYYSCIVISVKAVQSVAQSVTEAAEEEKEDESGADKQDEVEVHVGVEAVVE